ncbi:helix-turn-helix domain-containing protein [Chryseolinea soli]|uniref:AraC family transcriptional regulator n=1 Tax=Chryseolinea soli TaxID=2321403 RepID=A0A385SRT7_9BACT|nr:AraC family transcriptional regulator [Chryseolinea soli]AYB32685.1 AraC family transcriptional regulator [Chryseolinea soli]
MSDKILPITRVLEDSFVYSCAFEKQRGFEQFVPHHVLAFQFSGETHIQHQSGVIVLKKNQVLLARKHQLTKTVKIPGADKEYKIISVILTDIALQQFVSEADLTNNKKYEGENILLLKSDALMKSYFQSLLPYIEKSKKISKKLAAIKINEAIELVLNQKPSLKTFFFDFANSHKIDLQKFMLQNFHYNVPIENFAKLTGRSLAGFKRDFDKVFRTSPRKWLQEKRLAEAHYLIQQKKQKPGDIYLDLGFENLSHFYTSFKEKFGVTPETLIRQQP